MDVSIRTLETRQFAAAAFRQIGREMPKLDRAKVIGAALRQGGITLAIEAKPRKAGEKATYGQVALQGSHSFQFVAIADGVVLVVGTPGIVTDTALIDAAIEGFRRILAQSGADAEDIIFAPVAGTVETYIMAPKASWTSLTKLGFTRVTYLATLRGFIGAREGSNRLYFLPLAKARAGQVALEHWIETRQTFSTGAVRSLPYRMNALNLKAAPVTTAGGMEVVDLTNLARGEIKLVAREAAPTIEVLGDTDQNEVAIVEVNGGTGRRLTIIPRANFRSAIASARGQAPAAI